MSQYNNYQQPPYQQPPYQQQPYQQPYQPAPAPKDKTTAGLLGIFLGGLGIHKFYLGYNTAGIIMLLVFVLTGVGAPVMAIIGLIEGIIYLTKTDAQFQNEYVLQHKEWF